MGSKIPEILHTIDSFFAFSVSSTVRKESLLKQSINSAVDLLQTIPTRIMARLSFYLFVCCIWLCSPSESHSAPGSLLRGKHALDEDSGLGNTKTDAMDRRLKLTKTSPSRESLSRYRYEKKNMPCSKATKRKQGISKFKQSKLDPVKSKKVGCGMNAEPNIEVQCSADLRPFKATILVDFVGSAQNLTVEEKSALGASFVIVYNNKTYDNCDGYFRRLDNATLFTSRTMRRLQNVSNIRMTMSTGNNFYGIEGTCRDCPVSATGSFSLFDNGFRRHLLKIEERNLCDNTSAYDMAKLEASSIRNDTCTCPAISDPGQTLKPAAPTLQEFRQALNDDIVRLVNEGIISHISAIRSLTPVEDGSGDGVVLIDEDQDGDSLEEMSSFSYPPSTSVP